ncbi:alanine--tRNA ligase [bacterium]|nr:alanine--tRNA ligase [candidate division CSSED10-310 bacterium]
MTGNEIRTLFLDYFTGHDHLRIKSSSLVPAGDPTLLFTNAGMNQFKDVFTGKRPAPYPRAVSAQKCVRAGGKHNDLENVGFTARHHTFFEMLGNFSFGDYFKKVAIEMAWEFLTGVLKLPPAKLWITIFKDDDESHRLWRAITGFPEDRVLRLGEKDNFWAMGDVGPCGPCSEIHFDQGSAVGCGRPDCGPECDCDRFLELWNLVFMQYERDESGIMRPLPSPSIDTGMGLERVTAVLQGKTTNFASDLFTPIITAVAQLADATYGQTPKTDVSLHVIADHIRALTFLISDGVQPSNEWRGYVVRRILRRAMRHGVLLGLEEPFLYRLVDTVVNQMQEAYPELRDERERTTTVIEMEERRFVNTLRLGMQILNSYMDAHEARGERRLTGAEVFTLHDTYGFPPDLADEIVRDREFSFSMTDYEAAMEEQRRRARAAWKGAEQAAAGDRYARLPKVRFTGYETIEDRASVTAILVDGEEVETAGAGTLVEVVLDRTPFYGESGGQAGDTGELRWDDGTGHVLQAKKPSSAVIVHRVRITSGRLERGQAVTAMVDGVHRDHIGRNHTATHLLHAALRQVVGDHVKQAGSLVEAERFRFDFSHYQGLTDEELHRIEATVNHWILENHPVRTAVLPLTEAMAGGAMALFDEKYEDMVRVVTIPGVSKELCGGTHRGRTGDIGVFYITGEGSVAAGTRRIEGVTGMGAWEWSSRRQRVLEDLSRHMKAPVEELPERIERLLQSNRVLERQVDELKKKLSAGEIDKILEQGREVDGFKVYTALFDEVDTGVLRELTDVIRDRVKSGVVVLGAVIGGSVQLVAAVTRDLTPPLHAGNLIREVARSVGGGGGGKADLAQAGGRFPEKLPDALARVHELVSGVWKNSRGEQDER